jgi:hypothetical protein
MKNIKAPQKYLYHIPGTPDELTDSNYIVVAEKLMCDFDKNPYKESTKEQVLNLAKIMLYTHHNDNADGNIALDKNKNLILIDTDDVWIFMTKDKFLNSNELHKLAQFCAKKLILLSRSSSEFKKVVSFLTLQKVATGAKSNIDLLRKIITFYEHIGIIGAIHTDVKQVFSLSKKDRTEIMHAINKEFIKKISLQYSLNKERVQILKKTLYSDA